MQALEHRLERMVDGVFRRSQNSIRPIELGRRLVREMDDHRTVDVKGQRIVPNYFVVDLAPEDVETFAQYGDALSNELNEVVREYAREEGYQFMGPVSVLLELNEGLRPGRFEVTSSIRQTPTGHRAGSIVTPSGDRIPLTEHSENLIGRMPECAITVNDSGVSRRHASIRFNDGHFVISDLGSTNGTYVNNVKLTADHRLASGDAIRLGPVTLRFEAS